MTKRESILIAVVSFFVGVTIGMMVFPSKKGSVVVKGNHNYVRTGYKTNNCNGNSNQQKYNKKKEGKK